MAERSIDLNASTAQQQTGKMIYDRREAAAAKVVIPLRVLCETPESFEALAQNYGGIDPLRQAMRDERVIITAGNQDTFDYINKTLL